MAVNFRTHHIGTEDLFLFWLRHSELSEVHGFKSLVLAQEVVCTVLDFCQQCSVSKCDCVKSITCYFCSGVYPVCDGGWCGNPLHSGGAGAPDSANKVAELATLCKDDGVMSSFPHEDVRIRSSKNQVSCITFVRHSSRWDGSYSTYCRIKLPPTKYAA